MKLIPTLAAVYVLALIIAGHYFEPIKIVAYGLLVPMLVFAVYLLVDMFVEDIKEGL